MHHITFKSANKFPSIDDDFVPSFIGATQDGTYVAAVCLQPSYEDIQAIQEGKAICLSIVFNYPIPIICISVDDPENF